MAATRQQHSLIYRVLGAAKAAADNRKVHRSLQNLARGVSQFKAGLLGMRGMMMGFAASLVAIGLGLRRTVTDYANYTQAVSRLRTTLAATTNSYRTNAAVASETADAVGIQFGYSLTEANDAMTTMIQTGVGVHKAVRLFSSSMRLARVGEMDTANATRFLVDTMNMFNDEVGDHRNLREFADTMAGQLAVAANMSSTNIEDLQQAFRYAGTELSGLGYNSREVMSALAGLSTVGLRGTTAGTRLRGALLAIVRPSEQVKQTIAELTGNQDAWRQIMHDQHGELVNFPTMMQNLQNVVGRTTTTQERHNLITSIFGRRAMAAGISMSEMNRAAEKMLEVYQELGDDTRVRNRLMRMEEERMRSFGMQLQQLKHGASDLAIAFGEILFGAMDTSREGFGTHIRSIAQGIRLLGRMEEGVEGSAEEFRALSPQAQESARNIRDLFINISKLLKVVWAISKWMIDFTQRHPYLVAGIIAMRVAFGGFVPMIGAVGRAFIWFGRQAAASIVTASRGLGAMTMKMRMATVAMGIIGVAIVNELVPHMRDWAMSIAGVEGGLDELRTSGTAEWLEQNIPLVGNLAAAWVDVYNGLMQAIEAHDEMNARRQTTEETVTRASADARIRARASAMAGQARFSGMSDEELRGRAAGYEQYESQMRLAALLWTEEIRGREAVTQHLAEAGMQGEALASATEHIARIQEQQGDSLQRETESLVSSRGPFGILGRDTAGATRTATSQLVQFAGALQRLNQEAEGAGTGQGNVDVDVAEDAYVRRGGLMGVSSGDIIVSRDRLADAILASRGEMAGPAVGAATSQMTGPSPSTATGGGELSITVPVVIDGREVARANGRANIRQLERGGGRLPPGQRRSLRETGFNRVV